MSLSQTHTSSQLGSLPTTITCHAIDSMLMTLLCANAHDVHTDKCYRDMQTWSQPPSCEDGVTDIDILSVDGAFAAVTRKIWPPSWSGDGELESSKN